MATKKKRRLGRGLGSMINTPVKVDVPGSVGEPEASVAVAESPAAPVVSVDEDPSPGSLILVAPSDVRPNPYQPARYSMNPPWYRWRTRFGPPESCSRLWCVRPRADTS